MANKVDEKKQPGTEPAQPPAADQQAQTAQPPAADQQAQAAAADAITIGALHEMIMVVGDQIAVLTQQFEALGGKVAAFGDAVPALLNTTGEPQIEFDPAWLEGLVFKGAKEVKAEAGDNGRSVKRYQPFERPATVDDVLSHRVDDDTVVIVLSDGNKHVVEL